MRALHQGAARKRDRCANDRALADVGARCRGRAPGPAHLTPARHVVGAIIAGGASRRFGGTPKGLERVGDTRIIDRVRAALTPVSSEIVVVANDAEASGWLPGVSVIRDAFPGAGGMAGVHAALAMGHDAIVVAWDMPFVNVELLAMLMSHGTRSGALACVPESDSPYGIEPFCAWYSHSAQDSLEEFLRAGGGAARDYLATANVLRLPAAATREAGDPARMFFSVNAPSDLDRARAIAAQ